MWSPPQSCTRLCVLMITIIVSTNLSVQSQKIGNPEDSNFHLGIECGELPCLNVGEELIVNFDSQLELTCKGDQELEWVHPIHHAEFYEIIDEKSNESNPYFISTFKVGETITEDTGEYTCQFKNNKKIRNSTYVYVHDTNTSLILDIHQPIINVNVSEPLLIKCRTTLPNITVLLSYGHMMEDVTSDFEFDPREGFRKQHSTLDDTGVYICSASDSMVQVRVNVTSKISIYPFLNVGEEVVLNSDSQLELTCNGDQELEWVHPIQDTDIFNVISEKPKGANPYYISTFKVEDPIPEDTGEYTCQFKNNKQMQKSTYVYVHDTYTNLLVDIPIITVNVSEPLLITCRTTLPNITVALSHIIKKDVTSSFEFDPREGFRKQHAAPGDDGIYTCSTLNSSISVTIFLIDPATSTPSPPEGSVDPAPVPVRMIATAGFNWLLTLLVVALIICLVEGIFLYKITKAYKELKWFAS